MVSTQKFIEGQKARRGTADQHCLNVITSINMSNFCFYNQVIAITTTLCLLLINGVVLAETNLTNTDSNPVASVPALPKEKAALNTDKYSNVSTIDNPAPYRYLDWISPEELASWPPLKRPVLPRCCDGFYLPPSIQSETPAESAQIRVSADSYEADVGGNATFKGKVIVQQEDRQLESDYLELLQSEQSTFMKGNVRIRQKGMLLTGDEALFSFDKQGLDINNAEYVVHDGHIRGTASRIFNTDASTLQLDDSSYTTCEPNSNAWQFSAGSISLNNTSGWGTATNAMLNIKDTPVFYFPWLMFPIDDRRQTGFLFPTFGIDDNGTNIGLPLYLNLAPNADATMTFRNMTNRGSLIDAEFRYLLPFGEGQLGGSYLPNDSQTDTDRELTLFKHNGSFLNGWSFTADYTRVSDNDYFTDLKTTLDASSQTHLDQKAKLSYQSQFWNGSLLVQDYQTIDNLIADSDKPYRKMPQIRLGGHYLSNTIPIEWKWLGEYTHFEHPEESDDGIQDAYRTHLNPSIAVNFLRPWGYLKPMIQGYFTRYQLEGDSDAFINNISDDSPETSTYTASIDSGLVFERSLSFNDTSLNQTLEPRLFYLYSPNVDQNDNPALDSASLSFSYNQLFRDNRFSGIDKVGDTSQISVGITSRLTDAGTGREMFRASIGQSFYLKDREVQLLATSAPETDPRSPIVGQITWNQSAALTLYAEIQWNEQRNQIDKTDVQLSYQNKYHQIFNAAYRQQGDESDGSDFENSLDQIDLSTAWSLNEHWSIASRWIYEINEKRTFEGLFGVSYENCCWSVELMRRSYLKEDTNENSNGATVTDMTTRQGTYIQFQLKGLGGIGNALESVLDNAIFGYETRRKALANNF